MKSFLFLPALFVTSALLAQQRDTIFLERIVTDTPDPLYHDIFIDSTAAVRNKLTSFAFHHFDSTTYFDQLAALRPLKKASISALKDVPRKWIALYKWKNKYYLYSPSDFGNHSKVEMNDSTMVDFSMEGPQPSSYKKITRISATKLVIERANYWKGDRVEVQIIDTAKGIAVFSFGATKYRKGYRVLMVDAAKAHLFPTIVNYCETDKQGEFEFDELNFATLLKAKPTRKK
ncbi:MAG TPA: hypothetical protein VMR70_05410 [Flavisolibacter sp.]|nr:hypothetical protein [Flavisolibacter sp.]